MTSRDPECRAKLDAIEKILSRLKPDEAFFSIDEYGPFAIKQKGGTKRVAPGEHYVVPQWQKSKGWMILTAALELSGNQVTHFYSRKKNTDEMIMMADMLRFKYRSCSPIYLSWDVASWHISKELIAYLGKLNEQASRDGYPIVKTAPLPAGAQFLNVVESVFSGMAKAIIHNSDYASVDVASIPRAEAQGGLVAAAVLPCVTCSVPYCPFDHPIDSQRRREFSSGRIPVSISTVAISAMSSPAAPKYRTSSSGNTMRSR